MSGGQLQRCSVAALPVDDATWTAAVEPVYDAVCARVVGQPGTRTQCRRRAPGSRSVALTDAQRAAIEGWSKP